MDHDGVDPARGEAARVEAARVEAARASARRRREADLIDLCRWLTIPSISGSAQHRADVTEAARWVRRWLERLGARTVVVPTGHGPVVLALLTGVTPGLRPGPAPGMRPRPFPPVLIYGHLDVKPPGPGWARPAFRPTVVPGPQGRRIVARGASDDKGQLMAHLSALGAWAAGGGPPDDVLVIIDGAEEVGSPGLRRLLSSGRWAAIISELGVGPLPGPAPVLICSDTQLSQDHRPSLTCALRGAITLEVTLDAARPPVHAGRFGGRVLDPGLALSERLLRCRSWLQSWPGASDPRVRPALSITALHAGGPPGAVPATARAVVDVRVPPGVDPVGVSDRLQEMIMEPCLQGGNLQLHRRGAARGERFSLSTSVTRAVRHAVRGGFGVDLVAVASGGTVPGVTALTRALGCQTIMLGFGDPADGAHGPDEFLDTAVWSRAVDTSVLLLAGLSATTSSRKRIPALAAGDSMKQVSWPGR